VLVVAVAALAPAADPVSEKKADDPPRRSMVVPEDEWKKDKDELARLREAAKQKPLPPSKLQLKGKFEGNYIQLHAEYEFATYQPNTTIVLAGAPARATGASLTSNREGATRSTPLLRTDANGFLVVIDEAEPRGCRLTLDLALAVAFSEGGASIQLNLPGAAGTTLELELPPGSRDVRVDDKPLSDTPIRVTHTRAAPNEDVRRTVVEGPLAIAAEKLRVSWRAPAPRGALATEARSAIIARLNEEPSPKGRSMQIEARVTLDIRRGSTDEWRLTVPGRAEVKVSAGEEARLAGPIQGREDDKAVVGQRIIRLKEKSAEPLNVVVTATIPVRNGKLAVGPLIVQGAERQSGTILVLGTGAEPRFHPHGDTTRRNAEPEEKKAYPTLLCVFGFDQVPQAPQSLLEVEPEATRAFHSRLSHALKLELDRPSGRLQWTVVTRLNVESVATGVVGSIDILPPDRSMFVAPESPYPSGILGVPKEPLDGKIPVRITGNASKSVGISLPFRYDGDVESEGEARLTLPRLADVSGGRADITVEVPEDFELIPARGPDALALSGDTAQKKKWQPEADVSRTPDTIAVAWKPYKPAVKASGTAHVTLTGAQIQVRHELTLRLPPGPLRPVTLVLPRGLDAGNIKLIGGEWFDSAKRHVRLTKTAERGGAIEAVLVLEYWFGLPTTKPEGGKDTPLDARKLDIPFITVEEVADGDTRVRVWTDHGVVPELDPSAIEWERQNIEKVEGGKRLPVLVARTFQKNARLVLRLTDATGVQPVTVLVERALIRVEVTEGQGHLYRASFLLSRLLTRGLDVELPAPGSVLGLEFLLDGQTVSYDMVGEDGKIARLKLDPDLVRGAAVLDIKYRIPPGRVGDGLVQTTLSAPVLRGEPGRVLTRWRVTLPAGRVVLGPESGTGTDRVWNWNGRLFVPRLGSANDVERWFAGTDNLPSSEGTDESPDLVVLRSGLEPLTVTHVPWKPWMGICSVTTLLVGVGLYFLARRAGHGSPGWFWLSLLALSFGLGALWLFRPTALAALAFGSEPGAAILLLVAAFLWLLHERQRRQLVFLPSFRRGSHGSSLVRNGSPSRSTDVPMPPVVPSAVPALPREPSTTDAPRATM
jgi:hypothetical protein